MYYFTVHVVNNPLESQFDVACVDKLLSTFLIDSAMSANDAMAMNF